MLRIGIDIGGTFTDFAIWRGGGYGEVEAMKVPSTPPHFAEGVVRGLERLIADGHLPEDADALIVHGTTVSTNAVIERSGPPIALLVTEGFRDLLGIARLRVERPIDLFALRPPPLVPRRMVFEVLERMLADGSVAQKLDPAHAVAAARAAQRAGATAVALCFLHAHRNPAHERQAAAAIRAALPELDLVVSHEVWAQAGEYERASAAVLNAYSRRVMAGYIAEIRRFLERRLPRARLLITKSNGGLMTAAEAERMPIHTLLSGPAAGVAASAALGAMLESPNLLTMDMGGTSTDISLIRDGRAMASHEARVGDFPLMMPVTAIEAIGAGGGSIAWMDGPVLKVGPRSAGARPGPACYGQGGTQPTVSDAYLLCGYLSPDAPLAGGLRLRRDLAQQAIAPLAEALGCDPTEAAESIIAVAAANMLAGALPFIARLGVEPHEVALMIYGGAGAIHGPLLADEMGITSVIVPRLSAVFCGFGGLVSDLLHDGVRNVHGRALDGAGIANAFAAMRVEGTAWLAEQAEGVAPQFEHHAEMRYAGQSFEVETLLPAHAAEGDRAALEQAFHDEHRRLFGHASPDAPTEIIALRVRTRGRLDSPQAQPPRANGQAISRERRRPARFGGAWHDTKVLDWTGLAPGWHARGPVIIEQETATVVVPPGFTAALGRLGDLVLERAR
ncbi:MAG TPA: hydantoinase/oxoprolinase family protein [Acetobacteraceae bacterium]|nr:hydantoinase/oxoprolinase family protein [Acetobacteraceae bacterium]